MRPRIQFGLAALLAVAAFALAAHGLLSNPRLLRPATPPPAATPPGAQRRRRRSRRASRHPATARIAPTGRSSESRTTTATRRATNGHGRYRSGCGQGRARTEPASTDAKTDAKTTTRRRDALPSPGEALDPHIKKGSEDDVDAVGTRNIGGRGLGELVLDQLRDQAWASSTRWRSRSRRTW